MTTLFTPWGNFPIPHRDHNLPVAVMPVADTSSHPSPALSLLVKSLSRNRESSKEGKSRHGKVTRIHGKDGAHV